MIVQKTAARCYRGRMLLLGLAGVQKTGISLRSARAAHSNGPAYYDAKIEDIRNVGIIAHVDAVSG